MKWLLLAVAVAIAGIVAWRELQREEDPTFSSSLRDDLVYIYNFTSDMAPAIPEDPDNGSAFDEILYLMGRSELVGGGPLDRPGENAYRWMISSGDEITVTSKLCTDGVPCVNVVSVKPYSQQYLTTSPPPDRAASDTPKPPDSRQTPPGLSVRPDATVQKRDQLAAAALESNRPSLTGNWMQPWNAEKLAAKVRCGITFDSLQLQDVCMRNELDGYRKMQGDFGLPGDLVNAAKARCSKVFDAFQLQAVCMGNEKKGYDNLRQY